MDKYFLRIDCFDEIIVLCKAVTYGIKTNWKSSHIYNKLIVLSLLSRIINLLSILVNFDLNSDLSYYLQ